MLQQALNQNLSLESTVHALHAQIKEETDAFLAKRKSLNHQLKSQATAAQRAAYLEQTDLKHQWGSWKGILDRSNEQMAREGQRQRQRTSELKSRIQQLLALPVPQGVCLQRADNWRAEREARLPAQDRLAAIEAGRDAAEGYLATLLGGVQQLVNSLKQCEQEAQKLGVREGEAEGSAAS